MNSIISIVVDPFIIFLNHPFLAVNISVFKDSWRKTIQTAEELFLSNSKASFSQCLIGFECLL